MNKTSLFIPLGVFCLILFVGYVGFSLDDRHELPSALLGKPFPDFQAPMLYDPETIVTREHLLGEPQTFLRLEVDWQYSDELSLRGSGAGLDSAFSTGNLSLERRLVSPGLLHRLNETQLIGISAVFVTQSFGVSKLGMQSYDQNIPVSMRSSLYDPYQETGYGAGVRLALQSELTEGIALNAGFQSRINMNEFAHYRGVYSQPADLDRPARAKLGLAFKAGEKSWLNVSVERVL